MRVDEALERVRVIRHFSDRPLSDEDVSHIVDAGRRAGSSKNLQRWQFIVVRERATLSALAQVGAYAGHVAGAATAIALLTPDPRASEPLSVMWDLGRAAQNMVLAAWAMGIGSAPATVYEQAACRQILGYPADWHCEYILSFGWPAQPDDLTRPARAGGRRPLDELVHHKRW